MDFGIAKVLERRRAQHAEPRDASVHEPRADRRAHDRRAQRSLRARPRPLRVLRGRAAVSFGVAARASRICSAPRKRRSCPRRCARRFRPAIEEVLFQMLEKSPDARPGDARAVLGKLAPFVSAGARPPRSVPSGARPRSQASADPPGRRHDGLEARTGHSAACGHRGSRRASDQPRQIATRVAIALIVLLSVLAGLTAYVLRLRIGTTAEGSPDLDHAPARVGDAPSSAAGRR